MRQPFSIFGTIIVLCISCAVYGQNNDFGNDPRPQNQQAPPAQNYAGRDAQYNQRAAEQQQQMPDQRMGNQQQNMLPPDPGVEVSKHLIDYVECKEDIYKYCNRDGIDLRSDMGLLECLQNTGLSETQFLTSACEQVIWEFKVNLTQNVQFRTAAQRICDEEMRQSQYLAECGRMTEPGYALSCMLDYMHNMSQSSRCFQFLGRTARLAFSDFRVVGPFVKKCGASLKKFECGSLTPPSAHARVRVPHSQGSTLECLIEKLVKTAKNVKDPMELLDEDCRHELIRIVELQADDFHLDRQLFFACRHDRDRFCKDIQSGGGKVFECLISHRDDNFMEPECAKMLADRAVLMGQNYRLSHPLLDGCSKELESFKCFPNDRYNLSPNYHLSWVLLCLENAAHSVGTKFMESCKHELIKHRQMMMSEFRMSPELVMTCGREIDAYCSPHGDIEREGRTLHCLMEHAQSRDEKLRLGAQCMQAVTNVVKLADIGTNYKVDKVLYASCAKLIDGPCASDAESEASTLTCLMKHVDADMPRECEQRLLEVQYFMARDWSLDPDIYKACHHEAVSRCSAHNDWHLQTNIDNRPENGPQVLACLYRSAYDEKSPLSPQCANRIREVLRNRAIRVNLIPDIEESCREALSEYCSVNVKPMEELNCLQEHFEEQEFMRRHAQCSKELRRFTEMEAKDTRLNQLLTHACKPVIQTYCSQFVNEEIDHGDVLECLLSNKDKPEMNRKCHSYVNHFELLSLRDYTFSYRFTASCTPDIERHCRDHGSDKGLIIRCLSSVMFEHRVLGTKDDLSPACQEQLKTAYLQQEQVNLNFDDKEHMNDADPILMKKCSNELSNFNCRAEKSFETVIECLRGHFDELGDECKGLIFEREKIEAVDNTFDDELQSQCLKDIDIYCNGQKGEQVLDCLMNSKIVRVLSNRCQKVVLERMREKSRDIRLNPGLFEACKKEAETYCPDDYKNLNVPQYEKKTLEGVIVNCLRYQYANFGNNVRLNPKCKIEIAKVILTSEFDVQLDPPLYKACHNVITKHCSHIVVSRSGDFNSVLECLKNDFRQGAISNGKCAKEVARRLQESLVDLHLDPVLHEACAADVQRFCRDVPPGESRVIICLIDSLKIADSQMTKACKSRLTERNELWEKAHKENNMPLPESFGALVQAISNHPHRTSLLTWFAALVLVLFLVGCCCGRATKRIRRELKNR